MPHRVVILDDEHQARRLTEKALQDYNVQAYAEYETFMTAVAGGAGCILLDIQMPEISGYEVCRRLRQQEATSRTPVIFISASTDLNARLKGYAAGGDDFISKPFDLDELKAKVSRAVSNNRFQRELISSADEARLTAFEAMTHSAEQGEISRFIEQAGASVSASEAITLLIASLRNLGLNAVVAHWTDESPQYYSHQAEVRPLEIALLSNCREGTRIMDMERRIVVNYPHASVLVKNAPWEDDKRYGRIKDHLCVLMSGINARLASLHSERRCAQQDALLDALSNVQQALLQMQQQQNQRFVRAGE